MAGTASKVAEIRAAMPAVTRHVYLNTGTYGPLPLVAVEAMRAMQEEELADGRIVPERYPRTVEIKQQAREEVARLLGCSAHNIALTRHTTDGMNLAVMGLNWQPGDEIVTTDMEHPGGQGPVFNVVRRYGVVVRTARLGDGSGDVAGAIARLLTRRTRMVVLSHLTWNTGAVLPLEDVVDLAHREGILVAVDGAQSAGSIPVDVTALGVDVYAIPGQKWLCGPEGTGAVYVSDAAMDVLNLTVVGYASLAMGGLEITGGYLLPKATAERFEAGGVNLPAIAGQAASLAWIREFVGYEWAYRRIAELGQYAWQSLSEVRGVTVLTPRDRMAGLVSFTVEGIDPPTLVQKLWERNIIIRSIPHPPCARLSAGFYNNEEDIDRLVRAIAEICREL
uniref:Aminotransferase class V-fold PLP-dependent enzyme n=1 Tax=Thermorudis peleae TaxID=1382356 RepID=A0A831TEE2_9BACT